jgi:hypothetical protein
VDGGVSRLNYDQLTGTYAELQAAVATYDDIGVTAASPPVNYIGYTNGVLKYEDPQSDVGIEEFDWRSKIFRIPSGDQMVSRLMILFEPIRSGSFNITYRKNNTGWTLYKTVAFDATQGRTRMYFTKLVRANEYQFRIRCSEGDFKLLEFKIDLSATPEDKNE